MLIKARIRVLEDKEEIIYENCFNLEIKFNSNFNFFNFNSKFVYIGLCWLPAPYFKSTVISRIDELKGQ